MLKGFRVTNFKSLINVEFHPVGLNLIMGLNNAGKTNLCLALRFLSLTSRMPLDDAAGGSTPESWNFFNVYFSDDVSEFEAHATLPLEGQLLDYTYTLRLAGKKSKSTGRPGLPLKVVYESLKVSGGLFKERLLLENNGGKVKLLHEKRFLELPLPGSEYVETMAPTDATMLSRLYDLETNQRANLFKHYLGSWSYYNLSPNLMRSNVAKLMERRLVPDGANLSSVLYTLHNERPRDERKLVEAAKLIEPRLDVISFQSPDPEHVYMFFEDKHTHRFGVENVSDGTLRFLALCYLILANGQESGGAGAAPLIMIEEPENGIFVGHLKPLVEKMDDSGAHHQLVFTSHSPYFIDLFDSVLDGLHVVKSLETHSTVTKPDPETVKKRLGQFSLGDMHFRGLLE